MTQVYLPATLPMLQQLVTRRGAAHDHEAIVVGEHLHHGLAHVVVVVGHGHREASSARRVEGGDVARHTTSMRRPRTWRSVSPHYRG